MASEKRKGLGRGIAALMGTNGPNVEDLNSPYGETGGFETNTLKTSMDNISGKNNMHQRGPHYLITSWLEPGSSQPRRYFEEDSLKDLAKSIEEKGIIQPLLVQKIAEEKYAIIAGERRWRAAQIVGLDKVPVIVENYSETEAIEIALIENIQRSDLTAIEEATAYHHLMTNFKYTQDKIAKKVSKSRSHIANLLRLLTLPESIIELIQDGSLTMGHARALIGHPKAETIAKKIISDGLSVRQTESLIKTLNDKAEGIETIPEKAIKREKSTNKSHNRDQNPDMANLEDQITRALGMKVRLKTSENGGYIELTYTSFDQLDDFLSKIGAEF